MAMTSGIACGSGHPADRWRDLVGFQPAWHKPLGPSGVWLRHHEAEDRSGRFSQQRHSCEATGQQVNAFEPTFFSDTSVLDALPTGFSARCSTVEGQSQAKVELTVASDFELRPDRAAHGHAAGYFFENYTELSNRVAEDDASMPSDDVVQNAVAPPQLVAVPLRVGDGGWIVGDHVFARDREVILDVVVYDTGQGLDPAHEAAKTLIAAAIAKLRGGFGNIARSARSKLQSPRSAWSPP